jgi:hypothetical protein
MERRSGVRGDSPTSGRRGVVPRTRALREPGTLRSVDDIARRLGLSRHRVKARRAVVWSRVACARGSAKTIRLGSARLAVFFCEAPELLRATSSHRHARLPDAAPILPYRDTRISRQTEAATHCACPYDVQGTRDRTEYTCGKSRCRFSSCRKPQQGVSSAYKLREAYTDSVQTSC